MLLGVYCDNMKSVVALVLLAVAVSGGDNEQPSIAKIAQGRLQGKTKTSQDGQTYHAFSGIRYGKAPVGNLRFKLPVAADKWTDTFDATSYVTCCQVCLCVFIYVCPGMFKSSILQVNMFDPNNQIESGQEDCLALNVYTKNLPKENEKATNLKPVMVWIHGGAFIMGDGGPEFYGPERFMDHDIVRSFEAFRSRASFVYYSISHRSLSPSTTALDPSASCPLATMLSLATWACMTRLWP